jgi:hypothetical protein
MNQRQVVSDLLATFRAARDAGLCCIPASNDGSKRPWPDGPKWTQYESKRPTAEQGESWFASDAYSGLGLVCGAVSGNLELLEFEGRAVREGVLRDYAEAAKALGLDDLLRRVTSGYCEMSPSGGRHIFYRCADVIPGSSKLALRPATADELDEEPDEKWRVLIETKGEGGFGIIAPSNGSTHPSGRSWVLKQGGLAQIATISADEREALVNLARTFDQRPVDAYRPVRSDVTAGGRPGDDFAERGSIDEAVEGSGWSYVATSGANQLWRRPGKDRGHSATWHPDKRVFYVFSSSTAFPEVSKGYGLFQVLAFARFDGDFSAAARWCRQQGFGQPPAAADSCLSKEDDEDEDEKRSALVWKRPPDPFVIPRLRWLIEGLWCEGTYGELAGGQKTLKSYLAMFIDVGLAAGVDVLGRFKVPEAKPVLHLAGEGGEVGYWRRLERVCAALGISIDRVRPHLEVTFQRIPVTSPLFVESLSAELEAVRPALVHVDPWFAYSPRDVDTRQLIEVGAALESLGRLCADAGASLLINNHFNETGSGNELTRITGAGHAEWVDSWLLVWHRGERDVGAGRFKLGLEVGSRQWGGSTWDLDLDVGRFDETSAMHDGPITWTIAPPKSSGSAPPGADPVAQAKAEIRKIGGQARKPLTRQAWLARVKVRNESKRQAFDEMLLDKEIVQSSGGSTKRPVFVLK